MKKISNKNIYSSNFFGIASFVYLVIALQVMAGGMPSKGHGDPAKAYTDSPSFFWVLIGIESAGLIYLIGRGIYNRHQQRVNIEPLANIGPGFPPQYTNIIVAVFILLLGLFFLTLPLKEISEGLARGGTIFKDHRINEEREIFWRIVVSHFIVGTLPVLSSGLLLIFSPPKKIFAVKTEEQN